MITTKIECTQCNGVIDTTARTVALPYVCDTCLRAAEFQEIIRPASKLLTPELAHQTATVENTTLLIEDLQAQLKQAKDLAVDLGQQITAKEEAILEARKVCQESRDLVQQANAAIEYLKDRLADAQNAQKEAVDTVEGYRLTVNNCIRQIRIVTVQREFWKRRADYSRNQWREMRGDYNRLRFRGFWARVFNKNF